MTAELVGCPVEGFWGEPHRDEAAIEGQNRTSDFRCYKAHHPLCELRKATDKSIYKLLYIVRDPRDVVVSGGEYFDPPRFERFEVYVVQKIFRRIPGLKEWYERTFRSEAYRTRRMIEAACHGDPDFGWCQISWAEHFEQYAATEALVVRYEDLLEDPYTESRRVLNHLGLERSDDHVENAIWQQSLGRKKRELQQKGKDLRVINKGGSERWKDTLDSSEREKIEHALGEVMNKIGYKIK
nr:sulfotransferase domain-containing protein [Salinibacter ruber]